MRLKFWKKAEEEPARPEEGEKEEAEQIPREAQEGPMVGLWADLSRLRVKVESFDEIRKANTERFTRISEQIGELRGLIMDTNRSVSEMEVKVTKTVDLVEAVQPDKLMIEVRRTDGKIEAVRANIESNEAMMKTLVGELKDLRNRIAFFRGLEQVMKLNEDIKRELTEIQKTKAIIERHADKAETIFSEMQSRFAEMDKVTGTLKDLQSNMKSLTDLSDTLKVQMVKKSDRQELERLTKKLNEFEVHVGNVIDLMSRKAKELNDEFKDDVTKFQGMFDLELRKNKRMVELIENLSKDNPDLERNLLLLREVEQKAAQEEKLRNAVPVKHDDKKPWFNWTKKEERKEGKKEEKKGG